MKIGPMRTNATRTEKSSVAFTESTREGGRSHVSPQAGDQVRLSGLATELAEAVRAAALEGTAGADPARLAALKQSIESGTYEVDVHALAQAIVNEDFGAGPV